MRQRMKFENILYLRKKKTDLICKIFPSICIRSSRRNFPREIQRERKTGTICGLAIILVQNGFRVLMPWWQRMMRALIFVTIALGCQTIWLYLSSAKSQAGKLRTNMGNQICVLREPLFAKPEKCSWMKNANIANVVKFAKAAISQTSFQKMPKSIVFVRAVTIKGEANAPFYFPLTMYSRTAWVLAALWRTGEENRFDKPALISKISVKRVLQDCIFVTNTLPTHFEKLNP